MIEKLEDRVWAHEVYNEWINKLVDAVNSQEKRLMLAFKQLDAHSERLSRLEDRMDFVDPQPDTASQPEGCCRIQRTAK